MSMKMGIFQGAFPIGLDLSSCFRLAKAAGFDGVELALENADPILPEAVNDNPETTRAIEKSVGVDKPKEGGLRFQSKPDEVETIRAQAEAAGLCIPSVLTTQLFYYPLSSPIPAVSERAKAIIRQMIMATAQLGGEVVLIAPGMVTQNQSYQDTWKRSHVAIAELLPFAKQYGVCLAIENVWNKFLLSPLEFVEFIDSFEHPNVGAYFDVANVLTYGFPDQWIETLAQRVKQIHFKDYRLDIDNVQGFTYLMQGNVPWERVIQSLERIHYDGWIVVEVTPYRAHPDQVLWDSMAALHRLFDR
jgi:L-ribulose-5-phosphate 3-epimerase